MSYMAGVGGKGGLRKPRPPSSTRSSGTQGQGVEGRGMVPRAPCYALARDSPQSLGDQEDAALELWGKAGGSIGIQAQQGPKRHHQWKEGQGKLQEGNELALNLGVPLKVHPAFPLAEFDKPGKKRGENSSQRPWPHT